MEKAKDKYRLWIVRRHLPEFNLCSRMIIPILADTTPEELFPGGSFEPFDLDQIVPHAAPQPGQPLDERPMMSAEEARAKGVCLICQEDRPWPYDADRAVHFVCRDKRDREQAAQSEHSVARRRKPDTKHSP